MARATDAKRIAKAHTPLGGKLVFRELSGREEISRPFEYRLELLAEEDSGVDPKALLGRGMTAELEIQGGGSRFIDAQCIRFAYVGSETVTGGNTKLYRYEARLRPWTHYMTLASNCRVFQNLKVPDIVRKVFDKYPFPVDFRLSRDYRVWEYCVQYEETDFNFVSRLLEHEGIYYFFEHSMGNHKLVLADDIGAHRTLPGYPKIPHLATDKVAVPDEEWIDQWQMVQEVESGAYVTDDYDFKHPKAQLEVVNIDELPFPNGDKEIFDWPGGYVKTDDGEKYARARLEELQQPKEVVGAESNARGLAPGYLFTLERCPRRDQNREYLLLAVDLFVRDNPYHSGTGRPADWHFSFSAQPSQTPYRPARLTQKPRTTGPQTAFVVGLKDNRDEEIVCDEYGRVRVQFHWDREHQFDEESSCLIRVSSAWAGSNWGQISLPRVGQEVIVDFLNGDPDYPIITGRVYNGDQMPPWKLPDRKTQSGIRSRSTLKGGSAHANMIRFEDLKDKEELHVHAQRNLVTVVENDEIRQVQGHRHVQIHKDHIEHVRGAMELRVSKNQDVAIEAKKTETIGGDNDYTVNGSRREQVGGSTSLSVGTSQQERVGTNHALEAGMEIHLKAGMKVVIEAGMQLTLKGPGGFIDINPAGVFIQGTMVMVNSGGAAGSGGGSSPDSPASAKKADPSDPSQE